MVPLQSNTCHPTGSFGYVKPTGLLQLPILVLPSLFQIAYIMFFNTVTTHFKEYCRVGIEQLTVMEYPIHNMNLENQTSLKCNIKEDSRSIVMGADLLLLLALKWLIGHKVANYGRDVVTVISLNYQQTILRNQSR